MNIRLNVEELKFSSNNLKNVANEIQEMINRIEREVNNLPNNWEGRTAQAYQEQFINHKQKLIATKEFVEGMAKQIDTAITNSQTLDGDMANQIRN